MFIPLSRQYLLLLGMAKRNQKFKWQGWWREKSLDQISLSLTDYKHHLIVFIKVFVDYKSHLMLIIFQHAWRKSSAVLKAMFCNIYSDIEFLFCRKNRQPQWKCMKLSPGDTKVRSVVRSVVPVTKPKSDITVYWQTLQNTSTAL